MCAVKFQTDTLLTTFSRGKLNLESVQGNSRERSVTLSPNGEEDTIEQNLESEVEDDFIFVEDLKNDDENGVRDNIPLG